MSHYEHGDLAKFAEIGKARAAAGARRSSPGTAKVFEEGALTKREKSLIALAVAHAVQCPYCIEAYTTGAWRRAATSRR